MSGPLSFKQILNAPPSTFSPSDSVLIIIDAQNEYANGKLAITNLARSRPNILKLLNAFRKANGHIVHVLHQLPEGAPVFTPNTDRALEYEEHSADADSIDEAVTADKHTPASYTHNNLKATLDKTSFKKILLVGYLAHIRVSTTPRECVQSGFDVELVSSA